MCARREHLSGKMYEMVRGGARGTNRIAAEPFDRPPILRSTGVTAERLPRRQVVPVRLWGEWNNELIVNGRRLVAKAHFEMRVFQRIQARSFDRGVVRPIVSNRVNQRPHLGWRSDAEASICAHDGEPIIRNAGSSLLSGRFRFQRIHVFREKIKRLAVPGRQWTILPGAVR